MSRSARIVIAGLAIAAGAGCHDLADRAVQAADEMCACQTFECTKAGAIKLNELSIHEAEGVKKLAPDRARIYHDAQMRGGDCQDKLRAKR